MSLDNLTHLRVDLLIQMISALEVVVFYGPRHARVVHQASTRWRSLSALDLTHFVAPESIVRITPTEQVTDLHWPGSLNPSGVQIHVLAGQLATDRGQQRLRAGLEGDLVREAIPVHSGLRVGRGHLQPVKIKANVANVAAASASIVLE